MKRILTIFSIFGFSLGAQTQAVSLKPGSTAKAVIAVCATAVCAEGVPMGQFKATVNTSPALSWRLVYEEAEATALFQSTGYTYTVRGLYIGPSQEDCVAFAAKNNIKISNAVLNADQPSSAGKL